MAFRGKVAFITGAGSGMGRLAARRLAGGGASVAALDVNEEGLEETARGHDSIRTWPCDVTEEEAVRRVVTEVEDTLGPIDRVYNAAAIMPTGFLLDQSPALIRKIMDVNYDGVVNVTMATLPQMLERGRGELVNFASLAGWIPLMHFGAYNASKFAVVAFTEVLYHENRGRGVRICCVCPPPVATPLLDQATSQPKILKATPAIRPEQVLDKIDETLEAGKLWVFPGTGSKLVWRWRRFLPGMVWWRDHQVERR